MLGAAACGESEDGGDSGDGDATSTVAASPTGESATDSTATATSTAASESTATATGAATTATATEAASTATSTTEATAASGDATVSVGGNADLGEFLVGPDGMTLYIFTNDEPGVSNCSGGCATNWPPLVLESGDPVAGDGVTGELDVIMRDDGSTQVTYDGAPLYYWASDTAPGDATGHEVGGVWFVALVDQSTSSAGGGTSGSAPGY
jgi:predicted lipoprotein with Yx(FWY)xxD motif